MSLKPLSPDAIPQALAKVTRYRLLNEPWQAESICRDILAADPKNQEALYNLILSLSDQFTARSGPAIGDVLKLTGQLDDAYQQHYGRGIIHERQATAVLEGNSPHAGFIAHEHLELAMAEYERAEKLRPGNNADAILRWNACMRMIELHKLQPHVEEERPGMLGE